MSAMKRVASLVGLVGLCGASGVSAQAFGVDSSSAEVISAWDMQAGDSTAQWQTDVWGYRRMTAGTLSAGIHVPNGARVTTIVVDGCDSSSAGGVAFALYRLTSTGGEVLALADSGGPETAGCSLFSADLATPETVDYDSYRYLVGGGNQTTDGSTSVGAVRIIYQLQVSPPPGTPTFNDVPTSDPAFQFVEALADSGITAGCGNGNYCPDAPLTRRQMAVFLAKALGLHWPVSGVF